ncbi:MAG TPA: hypothetical protein VEY95_00640 [Azospirillaceae bacterium]|nr:hypothetical protein [Azospirillaceae bacterium]
MRTWTVHILEATIPGVLQRRVWRFVRAHGIDTGAHALGVVRTAGQRKILASPP